MVVEAENVRCNDNGDYGDGGCGGMVIVKMTIMVRLKTVFMVEVR